MLLDNNLNKIEYAVIIDGRILFKSKEAVIAENYKLNLSQDLQEKASIKLITTEGKEFLVE